jgi:hypothetical protein
LLLVLSGVSFMLKRKDWRDKLAEASEGDSGSPP